MQNVQQLLLVVGDVAKLQLGNRPLIGMIFPVALSSNANTWRPSRRRCCGRSTTWSCCSRCAGASRSAWSRARCCGGTYRAAWRCRRRRGTTCRSSRCCCRTSSRRRGWCWRRSAASRCPVKPKHLIGSARQRDAGCFLSPGRTDTKAAAGVLPGCALIGLHRAIPPKPRAVRDESHVGLNLDPVWPFGEDCHARQVDRKSGAYH